MNNTESQFLEMVNRCTKEELVAMMKDWLFFAELPVECMTEALKEHKEWNRQQVNEN